MKWIEALKKWNELNGYKKNDKSSKPWCVPKKNSDDYDEVKALMEKRESKRTVRAKEEAEKAKRLQLEKEAKEAEEAEKSKKALLVKKAKEAEEAEKAKPKVIAKPTKPKDSEERFEEYQRNQFKSKKKVETVIASEKTRKVVMDRIFEMLSSGSKRQMTYLFREFEKSYPELAKTESLRALFSLKKIADFYPTPAKCLEDDWITNKIKRAKKILEPTAGIGSMVNHALEVNPTAEIVANEKSLDFVKMMEVLFSGEKNIKFENTDFFKLPIENDYDLILENPPFSMGSNKKAYYDFLFRSLEMLNKSKKSHPSLVFISPKLNDFVRYDFGTEKIEKDKTFDEAMKKNIDYWIDQKDFFAQKEIQNALVKYLITYKNYKDEKKLKRMFENYTKSYYSDVEMNDDTTKFINDILYDFGFFQALFIGKCSGFGGTNVTANIYGFTGFGTTSGDGRSGGCSCSGGKRQLSQKLKEWNTALKEWNAKSEKWCVPIKNTKEYEEVKALYKKEQPPKPKEEPKKVEPKKEEPKKEEKKVEPKKEEKKIDIMDDKELYESVDLWHKIKEKEVSNELEQGTANYYGKSAFMERLEKEYGITSEDSQEKYWNDINDKWARNHGKKTLDDIRKLFAAKDEPKVESKPNVKAKPKVERNAKIDGFISDAIIADALYKLEKNDPFSKLKDKYENDITKAEKAFNDYMEKTYKLNSIGANKYWSQWVKELKKENGDFKEKIKEIYEANKPKPRELPVKILTKPETKVKERLEATPEIQAKFNKMQEEITKRRKEGNRLKKMYDMNRTDETAKAFNDFIIGFNALVDESNAIVKKYKIVKEKRK